MNYTRTALGLLSAQYRSVLKKCFLINMGLFALGAVAATPANAAIIDDYIGKKITYTGLGSDTVTSSFHYKWVQDETTGVYKLHRLTDATGADISTAAQDHRIWSDDDRLPGYPETLTTIDGGVFGGSADNPSGYHWGTAITIRLYETGYNETLKYIIGTEKPTVFVGYTSDLTNHLYLNDGGALVNNNQTLESVDATFIGNSVIGGYDPNAGTAYYYGIVYGGAISNGIFHMPSDISIDPTKPEEAVVIEKISGKFIANGVSTSYLTNDSFALNHVYYQVPVPEDPSERIPYYQRFYQAQYFGGAFGGAIVNYYGGIGEISNAIFANNYVVSTSNTDYAGHVGGAAIFNATLGYYHLIIDPSTWEIVDGETINAKSVIGDISGTFENNIAYTVDGNVYGGTISNQSGYYTISTMGNITGDFTGNTSTALTGNIYGSVIGNTIVDEGGTSTIASISGKFDKNTGSATNVYGGVIYNEGEITNGIKNASFTDNTFTASGEGFGAAIYTKKDLTIAADGENKQTLFKDNKINDVASAIFMDNANLTIAATNGGTATFYDTIDGENAAVAITGDATGTVQLYNDISNSDVSVEKVTVETTDGTLHDYSLKSLTSNADSKWKIDINTKDKKADTFATDASAATASSGTVTLSELNYVDSAKSDIGEGFKVQVLKTQGTADAAALQLALSDGLAEKFVISEKEETVVDEVTPNTKWSDEFNKTVKTTKKEGQFGLATTGTLNDSIGVTISTDSTEVKEKLGDTLVLVNQAQLADKNFTAGTADEVYTLGDDLGETYGNLTIKGVADGAQKSTIDLDGHDNFDVPESASLTLTDVNLKGDAPLNNAGTFSANNAEVEGEIVNQGSLTAKDSKLTTLTNDGSANLTGSSADDVTNNDDFKADSTDIATFTNDGKAALSNSTVNNITNNGSVDLTNTEFANIDGNDGIVNMLSDVDLSNKKVSNNKVVLQGVKATATTDSFGKNVDLVAESGSEVNVGNSKINLRHATFNKDSQLTLNVDNLQTFGAIKADSFDIANGATIDITFGQNPLDGKKTGEVALLSLSDGSDINNNNFKDEFHNNMYNFVRKSEKSGIYGVYQTETAEDISRENGGTESNQKAAGAWVDGPSHSNPTAQGIADDLARLAQTDGVEFNKVLTALAPNDDGMAQTALIDLTDRLLLTVDNHLIKTYLDSGLSSGDGKPDLSNVKAWIKTYYAKSKMQDHGDTYGYDADDRGFIAGVDKKVAHGTKVGIGMQFDDTDVNAFRRDVNIQTIQGYVYGEYRPSNWFVNGVMSYGRTDYDEDKFVLGRNIDAHYSADIYSVQGLTGYTFKYLTPELGARYYRIKRHGYVDGAMQSVSGNDLDLLRTTLGVKAETTYGIFKPNAYAGIMYDVISDSDDAVVSLPNGTSYTVDGKSMPRFGVEIGIGSTVVLNDNTEIGVGYEAKFRKHYQDHSGWIDFKYAF